MHNKRYAHEVNVFLLLIPLINVFNYYLTYQNISFNAHTLLTFTLDTLEGYAAWVIVHKIIVYLDKVLPFRGNVVKRLFIQISATLISGMGVIIGLTIIIHLILKGGPIPGEFFSFDIFIISVWFLVVNGIYVGMHFYREWQIAEQKRLEENKVKAGGLRVKRGKQELILSFEEVAGFVVDGDYVVCFTQRGDKFFLDQSMDKVASVLPQPSFYRLNRQFLVHRQIISGFEKAENGKLSIVLKTSSFSPKIVVSRIKASDFKKWFNPQ